MGPTLGLTILHQCSKWLNRMFAFATKFCEDRERTTCKPLAIPLHPSNISFRTGPFQVLSIPFTCTFSLCTFRLYPLFFHSNLQSIRDSERVQELAICEKAFKYAENEKDRPRMMQVYYISRLHCLLRLKLPDGKRESHKRF